MVDNKTKTSLIGHIQKKYITHEDLQYNTRARIILLYSFMIYFSCILSFGKFSYHIHLLKLPLNSYYFVKVFNVTLLKYDGFSGFPKT